jgi:hypothetical protein
MKSLHSGSSARGRFRPFSSAIRSQNKKARLRKSPARLPSCLLSVSLFNWMLTRCSRFSHVFADWYFNPAIANTHDRQTIHHHHIDCCQKRHHIHWILRSFQKWKVVALQAPGRLPDVGRKQDHLAGWKCFHEFDRRWTRRPAY